MRNRMLNNTKQSLEITIPTKAPKKLLHGTNSKSTRLDYLDTRCLELEGSSVQLPRIYQQYTHFLHHNAQIADSSFGQLINECTVKFDLG
jgi:hypothetical protein